MPDLLTIAETAERLRVSPRTVEREIAAGRLACVRIRSRRLVDPAWDRAWGAYIDEQARKQAEPKRGLTCLWSRADDDTDVWETSCRHAFTIIEGGPTDNQMAFCCYCGRPVDEEIGGSDAE